MKAHQASRTLARSDRNGRATQRVYSARLPVGEHCEKRPAGLTLNDSYGVKVAYSDQCVVPPKGFAGNVAGMEPNVSEAAL